MTIEIGKQVRLPIVGAYCDHTVDSFDAAAGLWKVTVNNANGSAYVSEAHIMEHNFKAIDPETIWVYGMGNLYASREKAIKEGQWINGTNYETISVLYNGVAFYKHYSTNVWD